MTSGIGDEEGERVDTRLRTPSCFRGRFEFVLYIDQAVGCTRTACRAEIFEYSQLIAVLELAEMVSRVEIAEVALQRCIRWAELRVKHVPS